EIRELFEKMATAWANGDGEAYGSCFTKNADYITFQGEHLQGRRTIVETHNKLWNGVLKGSVLVGEITKLEFLSPEVVVYHGIESEEHTSELQSRFDIVCRLLVE